MSDHDVGWVAGLVGPLRVRPGSRVSLPRDFDPGARFGVRKKKDGARLLRHGVELLAGYQDRLAAQDTYAVLVVLQAMDAAGKDGTIAGSASTWRVFSERLPHSGAMPGHGVRPRPGP